MLYKSLLALTLALYITSTSGQPTDEPLDIETSDGGLSDFDNSEDGVEAFDDTEEAFDVTDSGEAIATSDDGESGDDFEETEDESFDETEDAESNEDEDFDATESAEDDDEYESDDQDDNGIPDDLDDGDLDNDDIPDDVDTDDDNDNIPDDEDDDLDWCVAIESAGDCTERHDEAGDQECAYNDDEGRCYSVVRRSGIYGSGNYDDGFVAAQNAAKEESDQLYTVVGILGGIIGALVIVIVGGGYYFYNKAKIAESESEAAELVEPAMGQTINVSEHDETPMIQQQ